MPPNGSPVRIDPVDRRATVRTFVRALGRGDAEAAAAVCTDDVRLTSQGFERAWTGAAGIAALLDAAAGRWDEHRTIPNRFVDLPDGRILMLASVSGRSARSHSGYTVACLYAFADGRLSGADAYHDQAAAFAAAGLSTADVKGLGEAAGPAGLPRAQPLSQNPR